MSAHVTTTPAERATGREWLGLAVLALPTLLLALDVSVLYLALPHLSADLGADSTQMLWITDIYGFMIAGFLVTMGTLGDRIGRRRLLLTGGAAFGAASVVAAYSSSAQMLIGTRALLGIAGATLMPSTLALLTNMFRDPRQRATAVAVWFSCFMGGAAIGPVVGGALLESFWWGSAFLLGVPVMALLLLAGPLVLPEHRDPAGAGRIDLISVVLWLASVLSVIYALKELARAGWQPVALAALVVGLVAGAMFVRRQRRLEAPMLDMGLFANHAFSSALGLWLLVGTIMGGATLTVSLYMQMVQGLSPLRAGLWQVPWALTMIAANLAAPRIARRLRPGTVISAGLAFAVVGFVLLTQADSIGELVGAMMIVSIGVGVGLPLSQGLVLGAAPPAKAGSASAVSETSGEFGIALGLATLGSVGAAVYRAQLELPAGIPASVAEAARENIAGAVAVAGSLPDAVGAAVLEASRAAFTTALHAVAGVSAVVFVALAILAAAVLRSVRPIGQPETDNAGTAPDHAGAGDTRQREPVS